MRRDADRYRGECRASLDCRGARGRMCGGDAARRLRRLARKIDLGPVLDDDFVAFAICIWPEVLGKAVAVIAVAARALAKAFLPHERTGVITDILCRRHGE